MRLIKHVILAIFVMGMSGLGEQLNEKQALEQIVPVKKKYDNYVRLFKDDPAFSKEDFAKIKEVFNSIDKEIRQGNLSLIQDHISKLDREIDLAIVAFQERKTSASLPLDPAADGSIPAKEAENKPDPCREKQDMFYRGYRAESEGRYAEAIRQYLAFLDSDCQTGVDGDHAREFIAKRRQHLDECVGALSLATPGRPLDLSIPSILAEVELIAQTDPIWAAPRLASLRRAYAQAEAKADIPPAAGILPANQDPQAIPIEQVPQTPLAAAAPQKHALAMDIWQSAWGDFSDIDKLLEYLRDNRIRKINFNPGLGIDAKSWERSKKRLADLSMKIYKAGIEHVNLLYAELGFSIENYARLLRENPSLKIDTIIDDSEFTDNNRASFERNLAAVRKHGIRYGAFVTVEAVGNSGVSDATRYWVLDNADYPILMSYFSCDLDSQKAALKKFLDYADGQGRRGVVGVAILLGSKHVGREISCEKLLSAEQLVLFLSQLHAWCSTHPSYGGLVIETNQRLPRGPVAIDEPDLKQQ